MRQAPFHKHAIMFLLIVLSSCTMRPEDQLIKKLEERYANLYFNEESQKRKAIDSLKDFFQKNALSDARLNDVHVLLNRINDGHVVLFDNRPEKNITYGSQLKFILGSMAVESCSNCEPVLEKDKYEILEVNQEGFLRHLENEKDSVAASTKWGRDYRISRLLVNKHSDNEVLIKVKSRAGKIVSTKIPFVKNSPSSPVCVSGERLQEGVFKLNVLSLWCDDPLNADHSRDQIFLNFKAQFDNVINQVSESDRIVIDLRENGGGGDREVEYVLNTFFEKPVFMYHYQYLRKTHPGKRKWLERLWPYEISLWAEDEYHYSDPSNRGEKALFKNKLVTLISPGCFSSCEGIASSLKFGERSKLIGETTHGGAGDPVIFPIKDTPFSINLPTCVVWQKDGSLFEGRGVNPDIVLSQDLKMANDNVLKYAIDLIQ